MYSNVLVMDLAHGPQGIDLIICWRIKFVTHLPNVNSSQTVPRRNLAAAAALAVESYCGQGRLDRRI